MTLNRQYNFTPGSVIQSAQVNAEFDQLISALNTFVVDANFTSNRFVSDGDIVSAISALDANMVDSVPENYLAYNYSKGLIIKKDTGNEYTVKIEASASNKIIFAKTPDIFIEDANKTLNVSTVGNNQFVDIYIENDTGDTPVIQGTYPIKLVGKASGTIAYSTSASAGQYLIGSVYIKNTKIIGVNSLEIGNTFNYHNAIWGTEDPFSFTINSTSITYSTKCCYIPVFIPSSISYRIETQNVSVTGGSRWNFDIFVKKDTVASHYIGERLQPLVPDTDHGKTTRVLIDRDDSITSGLYTYYFGGRLGSDDANPCQIEIKWLYAHFIVHPTYTSFDAKA